MNKHLVIAQAIEFGIQEIVEDATILVCLTVSIIRQRIENLAYDIQWRSRYMWSTLKMPTQGKFHSMFYSYTEIDRRH